MLASVGVGASANSRKHNLYSRNADEDTRNTTTLLAIIRARSLAHCS